MDTWMTNAQLTNHPLNTIVLPGAHDAGTYDITCRSNISPDITPQQFLLRSRHNQPLDIYNVPN